MQSSRLKGLFSARRSHARSSSDTQASFTTRQQGCTHHFSSLPSNTEAELRSSQDEGPPAADANEADVSERPANQAADISDVGRYRRSRMKRSSKLGRSASVSSADAPRASLSTCSAPGAVSSDRSLISLDGVDVKSLALAFARSPATIARSRSETRFGPKARTRLYKRSLRHQSSDTVVVLGGMQKDSLITRSPSDVNVSAAGSAEPMAAPPKPKAGPHPKKKMLRSHSESAIDVTMLRTVKNSLMQESAAGGATPASGIVCSNEDLMKILSDARKQKVSRRRNNSVVCRLDATPELPGQELATAEEAETCLSENVAELARAPTPKKSAQAPPSSSPRSWATRHHSMRITSNRTTADLNTQAMDLHGWSPKHGSLAGSQNANASNFPAKMFSRGDKRNTGSGFCRNRSYPSANAQCPTELEPMLSNIEGDHDDNGNIVEADIEEEEEEEQEEEEQKEPKEEEVGEVGPQQSILPSTKSNTNPTMEAEVDNGPSTSGERASTTIVCTGFDPELLGQAIERHLSIAKVSPTHENKPERSRSGSIKSMWTQNRISSLVTRFPFRRENSTTAAV